jgi:hypothetical protein
VAAVVSPISSRKNVPFPAAAKRPVLSRVAPVNDPFTWPNNSLSSSDSGNAPQLIDRNESSARAERS